MVSSLLTLWLHSIKTDMYFLFVDVEQNFYITHHKKSIFKRRRVLHVSFFERHKMIFFSIATCLVRNAQIIDAKMRSKSLWRFREWHGPIALYGNGNCINSSLELQPYLPYWGQDNMAAILPTTFPNYNAGLKIDIVFLIFYWNSISRVNFN